MPGCSMAKGLRKSIARSTDTRADKKLERVFVDLSGKTAVPSIGGKRYTFIVRDNHTRFTRVYFLAKKSDAAGAFESFLAEVRADGTPSAVMCVRSDNRGECFGGEFGTLCRKRSIKQEFTPTDSPKYNDVAERALGLISDNALAARIQAPSIVPRCTVLHVIVGRRGILGMQRPESHCNQSKSREQVLIRVVRFTSHRLGSMSFPQVGHLQSKDRK